MEGLADQFIVSCGEAWVFLGARYDRALTTLNLKFFGRGEGILDRNEGHGYTQTIHILGLQCNSLKNDLVIFFFFNLINFSWIMLGLGWCGDVPAGHGVRRFTVPVLAALSAVHVAWIGFEAIDTVLVEVSRRLFKGVRRCGVVIGLLLGAAALEGVGLGRAYFLHI